MGSDSIEPVDYSSLALDDRVVRGLTDLHAAGVDFDKAVTLVTFSSKEVSYILAVARPPKVGSDTCRFTIPVGIEWDYTGGRAYVPAKAAASQVWQHPDLAGMLSWDPDLGRAYAVGALAAAGPTPAKALFFERAMAAEDLAALRVVALGATQYNIRWSTPLNPNGQACGYPKGLDAIWNWYLSPPGIWALDHRAFDSECSSGPASRLRVSQGDDANLATVRRQTGNSPGLAEAYWHGGPPFAGTPALKNSLSKVSAVATQLGLW